MFIEDSRGLSPVLPNAFTASIQPHSTQEWGSLQILVSFFDKNITIPKQREDMTSMGSCVCLS